MDTNLCIDLMWVVICGILVFFCKPVLLWWKLDLIKKHWKYNNEKLDGLCIGTIGFWAIGYTIMYGDSISSFIGNNFVFLTGVKDMHSLFFSNCICCNCSYNSIWCYCWKNKIYHILFFWWWPYLSIQFQVTGFGKWRMVNQIRLYRFCCSTVVHRWRLGFIGSCYNGRSQIGKYTNGLSNLFQVII
jgi:Amt family ammonium transporter